MKISVFGLGYVGCSVCACLSQKNHKIVGVDINTVKVDIINKGQTPIIEKDIGELIKESVGKRTLYATTDTNKAVLETDMGIVCVGTPSKNNHEIDLIYIQRICKDIGEALKEKEGFFVVVIMSTILPGTTEDIIIPLLEKYSGKSAGKAFGVCMNPEFTREGSSIHDFLNPPIVVIGQLNERSGEIAKEIYNGIDAPLTRTNLKTAEMVKYTANSFHALKITFANEIGSICKKLGIDSHEVMNIICKDVKLNISPAYLKPGFAFGGPCLPKDLRALVYKAKVLDLDLLLLNSLLESNRIQTQSVVEKLSEHKNKRLGFLGLSFKGGTDDLRESPIVGVIEIMLGKGFKVKIYDKLVSIAKLVGANKSYIEKEIPHISSLLCSSMDELVQSSDVIIIGSNDEEFEHIFKKINDGQIIIDLVRVKAANNSTRKDQYHGLSW